MKGYLVLLALCGFTVGAPQNWPYRDSLMPYRYGYPSQSQYKYLPQIEDDEDIGPYFAPKGRQDVVIGSEGDRVHPTERPGVGVVETGSVAPVVEPSKAPTTVEPVVTKAPAPPPKPFGPDGGNRPVQPPPFPPARPPLPPRQKEKEEEDEDEEDDEESDEGADDNDDDDEHPDDDGGDDDNDDDVEDDDDRRRQEPLSAEEKEKEKEKEKTPVVVKTVKVKADKVKSAGVPPAPVVVAKPVETKTVVKSTVKEPTVEEKEDKPVVDSNENTKPNEADDESSEEQGLEDGIEALVPGYVTDQGEVLVPVDTVTGDQPISIVPDPYTPPTRGVPLRNAPRFRSPYDDISFNNPYYYPEVFPGVQGRQDESEEAEPDNNEEDDEDRNNESNEEQERSEILTDFPPARTPELYAVIKSRIPATSSEEVYESQQVQGYQRPYQSQGYYQPQQFQGYQGPYQSQQGHGYYQQQQFQGYQGPYQPQQPQGFFRPRPQQQQSSQEVTMAVSLSNRNPVQYPQRRYQSPYQVPNRYQGPYGNPFLRNPFGYYGQAPVYRPQYGPVQRRPVNPFYGGIRPRPVYKRPAFNPNYAFGGGDFTPVFIKRNPYTGGKRPAASGAKPVGYSQKVKPNSPIRRPTPVTYQDDEPYPFEQPYPYHIVQESTSASDETSVPVETDSSSVESPKQTTPKIRRNAKMAKKFNKKSSPKQKKATDPDPLNILKKITMKRS